MKDKSELMSSAERQLTLQLPWLEPVFAQLCVQMRAGRFPSATLITGAEGIGKLQLAFSLKAALVCRESHGVKEPTVNSGAYSLPCGHCKSCLLVKADTHPDIMDIMPEEKGKAIRVDQIRALSDFVYTRPQIGSRRVVLLHPAEAMNLNSANALLKTLEEPASDTCLLLLSSNPARLLPTIRSRCLKLTLVIPEQAQARRWLSERWPGEGLDRALMNAHGSPLKALEDLQSGEDAIRMQVIDEWKGFMAGTRDVFSVAENWAKLEPERLLDWMMTILHAQARSSTYGLSEPKIFQLFSELLDIARGQNEKRNLSLQLQWENWLMHSKAKG
jgi:DNA polymerase-3 subunit delta'